MSNRLRVLLVDDNADDRLLVLRELRQEFPDVQAEHVIESRELDEALDRREFDLVITDFRLRWTNGIRVLEAVKTRCPGCPVIMFTATGNEEVAVEAMKTGLDDYVVKKPSHFVRLGAAVRSALALSQERLRFAEPDARLSLLSPRERGVIDLVTFGKTNKVIAHQLGVSLKTVQIHRAKAMKKLQVGNVAELTRLVLTAEPPDESQ